MFSVIILAAGQGSRMNLGYNKMFYEIEAGLSIIEKSVKSFLFHEMIDEIIVVCQLDEFDKMQEILNEYPVKLTSGGSQRYDSVWEGLKIVKNNYVLIHDGARCFISYEKIAKVIKATLENQATCLAMPANDTIHLVKQGYLSKTLDRQDVYLAQTPQGFRVDIIKEAYQKFFSSSKTLMVTDDAMLVNEFTDYQVLIVKSDSSNQKITNLEDIEND